MWTVNMFSVGRSSVWQRLCGTIRMADTVRSASFSAGGSNRAGPVYELRIYSIKPEKFSTFQQVMANKFDVRLKFSQPLGYWIADLGGIFQAVHIWPYESVSQRNALRGTMGKNEQWQKEFLSVFLPCVSRMDNTLLMLRPGTSLNTHFKSSPSAAYELLSLPAGQGEVSAEPLSDAETVVGRFNTIYGDINTEYRLMRYPDADTAVTHARRRLERTGDVTGYSRFMVPHDCSPIK